ncbi:MAG: helix-turn-helix domain-containing protein [Gammaproteobacteria bacterium]|nr:helix-turn-helix domain-containing protein [Gammaproteobacteria bacterium]
MKEVVVLAFDNCLTSSVIGLLDVFEISNNFSKMFTDNDQKLFNVSLASVDGRSVKSFSQFPIHVDKSVEEISRADFIIIPPMMNEIEKVLARNQRLVTWLIERHAQGSVLASVCTGIFFLAEADLLEGKSVTTNPLMVSLFQQRYPAVETDVTRVLIDEGDILTAGPTYAFIDLVVFLIEKLGGSNLAMQCSKLLLHDKNRKSQSPYFLSAMEQSHTDNDVQRIQDWIQQNRINAMTVEDIALRFHMSPRNLVRRFRSATGDTPLTYLQRLRVEDAKRKLENSRQSVDQITLDIGYSDAKSFGRLFKRMTTLSPSEYRKRFAAREL